MILHVKIAKVMILSYLLHCFLIFQVTHNENKVMILSYLLHCFLIFQVTHNENALAAVALGGLRSEVSEANET